MTDLAARSRMQLGEWLAESDHAAHKEILWTWLFRRGGRDFSERGGHGPLTAALVERLRRETAAGRPEVLWEHTCDDGMLCVSSQVGCTSPAASATSARSRTCGISSWAKSSYRSSSPATVSAMMIRSAETPQRLTNVVFMGIGKPFYH